MSKKCKWCGKKISIFSSEGEHLKDMQFIDSEVVEKDGIKFIHVEESKGKTYKFKWVPLIKFLKIKLDIR